MRLLALGVDHRSAPAAAREAVAFNEGKVGEGLDALSRAFPGNEFVILSTCNRVEVYAGGPPDTIPEVGALTAFLTDFHGVSPALFAGHLVSHHDAGAVGHLFRVASSLESLVLGEGQIMGQVREAYREAVAHKTAGPIFHSVFQTALRVGKLVREKTGMDQGKLSVASVAVDLACEVFDTFADKTVLVIGAGKMGDLTLQHLKGLRPGRILITNRNPERAEAAAQRWRGEAVAFERLDQALIDADLIISTTAADEPVVTFDRYAEAQRARRNRLSLILDIAIPRDFDPKIGDLDQVTLYNVDDLRSHVERNLKRRQKGIDPALQIIERETAACYATIQHQEAAGKVLRQLGNHADQIRERELENLFASLSRLSDSDREAIARMAIRLQNQFLHHPRAAVRSAVAQADPELPHPLLSAVRHLFGLAEGPNKTLA